MTSPYLTIPQTAAYLQVSVSTVRRMIKRGELAATKVGAQWRIKTEHLEILVLHTLPEPGCWRCKELVLAEAEERVPAFHEPLPTHPPRTQRSGHLRDRMTTRDQLRPL